VRGEKAGVAALIYNYERLERGMVT